MALVRSTDIFPWSIINVYHLFRWRTHSIQSSAWPAVQIPELQGMRVRKNVICDRDRHWAISPVAVKGIGRFTKVALLMYPPGSGVLT